VLATIYVKLRARFRSLYFLMAKFLSRQASHNEQLTLTRAGGRHSRFSSLFSGVPIDRSPITIPTLLTFLSVWLMKKGKWLEFA
jgi:hypothetical protein